MGTRMSASRAESLSVMIKVMNTMTMRYARTVSTSSSLFMLMA
jgi:hypothetical protein